MNIEELEKLRKNITNSYLKIFLIAFLLLLIPTIGIIVINTFDTINFLSTIVIPAIFAFVIALVITFLINHKKDKEFKMAFKDYCFRNILSEKFTDISACFEQGLTQEEVEELRLVAMGSNFSSDDYITAKYKDINFKQSDVDIQQVVSTGKSTTYIQIFKGQILEFDFNKNFKANIKIVEKGFYSSYGYSPATGDKVKLEDEEFNRMFSVSSTCEQDAFYILTPQFMEKLKNLARQDTDKMAFLFRDNKLYVAVYNNTNSFEHSVFTELVEEKVLANIRKDIKVITDFVDVLTLDNDLFKQ